jgi:hypothetical protein
MGQRLIISEEERSQIGKMHGLKNEPILSEQFHGKAVYSVLDHIVNSGRMKQKEEGDTLSISGSGGPDNELYNTLKSEAEKNEKKFLELINMDMNREFGKFKTIKITLNGYNFTGNIILTRNSLGDDFSMTMNDDSEN